MTLIQITITSTTDGNNPLEEMKDTSHTHKKIVWNAVLGWHLKNNWMICVHFQGKPFNITVIQVYAPTTNAEKAEVEQFYEDLQDFLEDIFSS